MKRVAAVALGLAALPCLAQSSMEISGSGGMLAFADNPVGYQFFKSDNTPANAVNFHNGWLAVARFTVNPGGRLGHEAGLGYGHNWLRLDYNDILELDQRRITWLWFYNLLVCATPDEAVFRPCLAAGPHMIRYDAPENLPVLSHGWDTKYGVNFGGVVKFRLGYHYLVRIDFRDYMNRKPFGLIAKHGWIEQREFSAGFGLRF